MMGVYIKNMEMPTSEEECKFFQPAPFRAPVCVVSGVCHGIDNCPLVPVPPHGRLIDADALRLLYDFNGYEPTGDMTEEEFDRLMCRLPVIRANIDDAPTIIEEER